MYGPQERAIRRSRQQSARQRRRRFAGLAVTALAALVAGLVVGSGDGGKSVTPQQMVRAQREAQPVHFTVSVSGDL